MSDTEHVSDTEQYSVAAAGTELKLVCTEQRFAVQGNARYIPGKARYSVCTEYLLVVGDMLYRVPGIARVCTEYRMVGTDMLYRVLVGIESLHRVLLGIVIRYRVPLGIRCRSEKEAYEMYCEYAHNAGFSVRKEHHSYWPNSRIIKSKDFVCSKAGQKKGIDLNSQTKYRKSNTRTGCPAMIRFAGDLQNHDWLKDLYRIRNKWSTAFNKNCFNLGILSTQRSECTNNVCHGISKATSSITECFLGLEKLMITWRRNEQDEDFRCSQSDVVPVIRSSPILKQAARYYSRKLYSFFEEEFLQGVGGMSIVHASADSTTFFVKNADRCDQPQQWTVHVDAADNSVHCTCGKFSMMGILCSHIMRVFRQLDISKIPSQYLLLRWSARGRKDFYAGPTVTGMGNKPIHSNDGGSGMIFRNHLSRFAYQISTRAQGNEDAEQYMLAAMVEMADNVDFILAGKPSNQGDNQNTAGTAPNKVKDPVKCRPKGVSNARLKSHWEKKKPKRKRTSNQDNTSKEDTGPAHKFVHATFSTIPECLTEEYILRRPSSLPSAEYTRMMMEIIDSDRQS
ncbi:hypothetical protein M5K25_002682 [Dendrobium thyrsiflorum]|uniref:Protein FAR1-RELATED SEQUENCE n=1 Tax=Dendrobium thyrsiflorum TaxID=117978 RepID=A0ABD0VNV4_DENTH